MSILQGTVELQALHDMLSQRYGKDKSASKNTGIIEKVIAKIIERSGKSGGIKGLAKYVGS
jgi:hypothetical protein